MTTPYFSLKNISAKHINIFYEYTPVFYHVDLGNLYHYQIPALYSFSCKNGADCNNINGSCICPPGFLGKDCSQLVSRIKYDSCLMSKPFHKSVLPNVTSLQKVPIKNISAIWSLIFTRSFKKNSFSNHVFDKLKMFINPSHVLLLVSDRKVWTKLLPELYLSAEL